MVPIAKAAVLLVLLGGATVSTYAVANGGFGNKAKSSENSEEVKTTDTSKGDAAASSQPEGAKNTVTPGGPSATETTGLQEGADASENPAQGSLASKSTIQKSGEAGNTAETSSKGGSDGQPASVSGPSVSSTT